MSFTSEIKSEIARILPRTDCCAVSELCCALLSSGAISYRGPGRYSVSLATADAAAAKHYYRILRDRFSFEGDASTLRSSAFSSILTAAAKLAAPRTSLPYMTVGNVSASLPGS